LIYSGLNYNTKQLMSFSAQQARLFLGSLEGKTTVFRVSDRPTNLKFARAILGLLAEDGRGCNLLDLDAFYSSNLETLAAKVPRDGLASIDITMPGPGSEVETILAALFLEGHDRPLLVDSTNTLYQLLSLRNPRSASRKFRFFVSALSNWAKSNGKPVIASIYDRRPRTHRKASGTLADAFDNSVSFSDKASGLAFRCERGSMWRGGAFFLSLDD